MRVRIDISGRLSGRPSKKAPLAGRLRVRLDVVGPLQRSSARSARAVAGALFAVLSAMIWAKASAAGGEAIAFGNAVPGPRGAAPVPALGRLGDAAADEPGLEPAEAFARFRLSRERARPGDRVAVRFSVEASAPLDALTVAIDFDESVVSFVELRSLAAAEDAALDRVTPVANAGDAVPGPQSDEGWIAFEIGAQDGAMLGLPVGVEVDLFDIVFDVLADAPLGATPLEFRRVGAGDTVRDNVALGVDAEGVPGQIPVIPPEDAPGGEIEIIGEIGFFVRGDVDLDCEHEVTDAVRTLLWLFVGGVDLPCRDAADADDSGRIDLADPVYTLSWLYTGGQVFAPPFPSVGEDPSPDRLDCDDGIFALEGCAAPTGNP
jgi:hypothetical protein